MESTEGREEEVQPEHPTVCIIQCMRHKENRQLTRLSSTRQYLSPADGSLWMSSIRTEATPATAYAASPMSLQMASLAAADWSAIRGGNTPGASNMSSPSPSLTHLAEGKRAGGCTREWMISCDMAACMSLHRPSYRGRRDRSLQTPPPDRFGCYCTLQRKHRCARHVTHGLAAGR